MIGERVERTQIKRKFGNNFQKEVSKICRVSQKLALYKAKIFGIEIQKLAKLGHFMNGVNFIVLMKQIC